MLFMMIYFKQSCGYCFHTTHVVSTSYASKCILSAVGFFKFQDNMLSDLWVKGGMGKDHFLFPQIHTQKVTK